MAQRPLWRLLLIVPAILLLTILALAGTAWLWFDPDAYKDRIVAEVARQTGRKLVLGGKLRLTLAPSPALEASDIAFANAQGGSRPQMVTAQRVQAEIAWLPLLRRRIVVTRLTLIGPDLLLELDASGRGNWQMSDQPPNTAPPSQSAASDGGQKKWPVIVQGLRLVDGRLTWHGARTVALAIEKLELHEATPDTPIALSATASHDGTGFVLSGTFGPLSRLRDTAATTPWPVTLSVQSAGATLDIDGTLQPPRLLSGYDLAIRATAPDLALVAPLVPGAALPALRDLRLGFHLATGTFIPVVTDLVLHAGASDLDATVPGLKLATLDVSLPGADGPMHAHADGVYAGSPLRLDAAGGTLRALLPGGDDTPFPLDISAEIAGAAAHVQGSLAHPRTRTGLTADVTATLPDLAAFSPLLRRNLPALRDISFATKIVSAAAPGQGVTLQAIRLTLPQGDLAGDLVLGFGPRPSLRGTLQGKRLDIDALRATSQDPAGGAAAPAPAAAPPAAAPNRFVIPDTKFTVDSLRRADADLRLDYGELVAGGATYRQVAGHLVLQDGRLVVDPAAATLAAGAATGRLEIDARASPAKVALALHSPGLALKPLLTQFGQPGDVVGTLQVEADLHGVGDTPHAVAGSADGMLGLAMVGGTVDGRLLDATFGELLRTVRLPGESVGDAHANVRCFALRLDAEHGIAAVRAMLVDVSRLRIAGSGTVDFGREMLALRLRPFVKVAGSGVVVPLRVAGTFRKPLVKVDPTGAPEAAAATAVELANEGAAISSVTSALAAAGEHLLGEADTGDCGPALALARDGKPGPDPAPLKQDKAAPAINDVLKRLFK